MSASEENILREAIVARNARAVTRFFRKQTDTAFINSSPLYSGIVDRRQGTIEPRRYRWVFTPMAIRIMQLSGAHGWVDPAPVVVYRTDVCSSSNGSKTVLKQVREMESRFWAACDHLLQFLKAQEFGADDTHRIEDFQAEPFASVKTLGPWSIPRMHCNGSSPARQIWLPVVSNVLTSTVIRGLKCKK